MLIRVEFAEGGSQGVAICLEKCWVYGCVYLGNRTSGLGGYSCKRVGVPQTGSWGADSTASGKHSCSFVGVESGLMMCSARCWLCCNPKPYTLNHSYYSLSEVSLIRLRTHMPRLDCRSVSAETLNPLPKP